MHAAGILVPPSPHDQLNEQQRTMWSTTRAKIETFLPGFLTEVIPLSEVVAPGEEPSSLNVA